MRTHKSFYDLLRFKLRCMGPWAFARYMRNMGFRLEYTLRVMFPTKYGRSKHVHT